MTIVGLVIQELLAIFEGTVANFIVTVVALVGAMWSLRWLGYEMQSVYRSRLSERTAQFGYWQLVVSTPYYPYFRTSTELMYLLNLLSMITLTAVCSVVSLQLSRKEDVLRRST